MSFSHFALVGLLLSQASAISLSSGIASSQPYVHSATCRTKLATTSIASVPTTTITRRVHDPTPVVVFSTIQDTVTVTPSVSTLTESDYETITVTSTATTVTDVFSTTSTEFDTTTLTVTPADVTSTITDVFAYTSTSTVTVATSSGFTPLVDTLPTTTSPAKRSLDTEDESCAPILDDYQYAEEVICHEKIILKTTTTSTVTATPITTTAVAPSTTVTATISITSSSVVVPSDVSTTLSFSTTSTITETSTASAVTDTVTSTLTVISAIETASTYAACAANNVAGVPLSSEFGSLAGEYFYLINFSGISGESLTVGSSASAYDCCVSCQEKSNCAISYYNQLTSSIAYCYLVDTTVCTAGSNSNYATAYMRTTADTIQMSNGNCGRIKSS
ncbi:hypothetical protein N7466_000175 [Penicillium verhagenii]|uniref:uncharacterized protein n=1 Tax=Penicillium verhagenii TaxID=1562060 RepID=UPI002545A2CB|nr:uncharacterized protein N7466_000175 [Penicillium verhagenii]KAJ5947160.1 hypothetical protein N7466_000175 [Penicillium verhagenii]